MIFKRKEESHGLGQAEGDHRDSGPGDSSGLGPLYCTFDTSTDPGRSFLSDLAGVDVAPSLPPPLPVRQQDALITGWKRARVTFSDGNYSLEGVGSQEPYGVEQVAKCRAFGGVSFSGVTTFGGPLIYGTPPSLYYTPSYAMDPPKPAHAAPDPNCTCGFYVLPTREDAEGLTEYPTPFLLEVEIYGKVIRCEKGYRAEKQRVLRIEVRRRCHFCPKDPEYLGVDTSDGIRPLCGRHAEEFVWITLDDLAGLLGTEVRWEA